jgi:hypothetical protein
MTFGVLRKFIVLGLVPRMTGKARLLPTTVMPTEVGTQTTANMTDISVYQHPGLRLVGEASNT